MTKTGKYRIIERSQIEALQTLSGNPSDRTQLIGRRSNFPNPNVHLILDDVLSKEPLAPAVVDGDSDSSAH